MLKRSKPFKLLYPYFLLLILFLTACSDNSTPLEQTPGTAERSPGPAVTSMPPTPTIFTATTPGSTSGLAGPGSRSNLQPTPGSAIKDTRTVINLWTGGWKGNQDYENYLNNLIDNYRSKYSKKFTLDWQDFGEELPKKLEEAFQTNNSILPDLILLGPGEIYQFAGANKLEDLGPLLGNEVQNRYAVPALDAMRFELGEISGVYGLPWMASTRVSIINKKLWQLASLEIAKLPKTFDELDQILPSLRDKTPLEVRPVWLKPDPLADFLMEDAPLFRYSSEGKREVTLNSTANQGKWQYYLNRRKDNYFAPEALDANPEEALSRYSAGKVVVWLDAAPFLPRLKAQNPDLYNNSQVTLHPVSKGNVLPLKIQGWSIPKGSTHKKEALDFLLFLDNDENQLEFAKLAQIVIPTTKKDLLDPYITAESNPLSQSRSIMAQALPLTRPPEQLIPVPISLKTGEKLLSALYSAQSDIWNKGSKPQDVLGEAAKVWNELLK